MDDAIKKIGKSTKLHWFHWVVVIASLILTFSVWYITKRQVQEKAEQRFEQQADNLIRQVQERMLKYEDALWGGVASIHAQDRELDAQKWSRFANALNIENKYPGINGIGVIYEVLPEKLQGYLAKERQARPDYQIHPQHEQTEYWPITYIEPVVSNKAAVGLDMAFETNRFTAAKKARDTGKAQITGPIVLVQDAKKTPGFLFYVPFYSVTGDLTDVAMRQQHFEGLVYAPFIMHQLISGTLLNKNRDVNFSVTDGDDLLFSELGANDEDVDANPLYAKDVSVEMYGRTWIFHIQSAESFRELAENNQPLVVLMGGVLIDALLLALFVALTRSNKHAMEYADQMTTDLQMASDKLRAVLKAAPNGILSIDQAGIIQSANEAITHIFGYAEQELVGTAIETLVPNDYHGQHRQDVANYMTDGVSKKMAEGREVEGVHKDGRFIPLEVGISRTVLADGSIQIVATVQDISFRKSEEELKRKFVDTLTESNTELERFAYVASHDMQEPIRMVTSFSEIIAKDYAEKLDATGREYLAFVVNAGKRMKDLVEDLLDYSRVGNEGGNYVAFDGDNILSGVLENLHGIINEHQAIVTHDSLPNLYGNPVQLMRVLQNLITNGIKYQPKGNRPEIDIALEDQGEFWKFEVKDNGLGVKEEYIEQIFQPFRRLHVWDHIQGTGLGLSICKKIIESHDGTMWVTSAPGEGSIFAFTIAKPLASQTEEVA